MTEARKGQISFIILKKMVQDKPLKLNQGDFQRSLGSAVKQLKNDNISKEEVSELFEEIIIEAVNNMFPKKPR